MDGGTNADKSTWTTAANDAYSTLISRGWDIDINDSARAASGSNYYVNHQDGCISFGQFKPGTVHVSGKEYQEDFDNEHDAIARVLELNKAFFPVWDREQYYKNGDRVLFANRIYRALQDIDSNTFELPDLVIDPDAEVPTPMNRKALWAEVYDPADEYVV